jgi:N-acetylmuramoyl-L-alanine amidase
MKLCLDPGHGGHDSGADGPTGLSEAKVVLSICQYAQPALESFGIEVRLTRKSDVYIELGARCGIANDWNADYFLSVHLNSDGPSAVGVETLYASERGRALALLIQATVLSATGDTDRGLKHRSDLYVLNGTTMPAALAELGFISNPAFEAKFRTAEYQQLLAWALVTGLAKFLGMVPKDVSPKEIRP